MSKAKRKQLIASLLMLSLGSCPAMASTIPIGAAVPNSVGAYIYVDENSNVNEFTVGRVEGWIGTNQGAVVNYYSGRDLILNAADGAVQEYVKNKAGYDIGGAIYNSQLANPEAKVVINGDSYFSGNTANRAGAIYNDGGFEFNGNVTFDNNIATGASGAPGGGAILNADGTVSFQEGSTVIFSNNKATGDGGAILNATTLTDRINSFDLTKVDSVKFEKNTATGNGGAVANIEFIDADGTFKANNAIFSENGAANGGAIYNDSIAELTDSEFIGNTSSTYGGAVMSTEGSDLTITNGTFTGNKVTGDVKASYGGAIFNQGKMEVSGNFSGNEAGRGGAIYNYTTAETTIKSGTVFEYNKSTYGHGSAVYTFNGMTIEDNVEFKNNHANWGGALAVELRESATMPMPPKDTVVIGENVRFEDNTSGAGGAAIVNTNGKITIADGATFIGNESGAGGGAIYNTMDKDPVDGTAISSGITLGSATFENNSTTGNGGAIYNDDKSTVTITGKTTFSGNTATGNGGAIANAADSVIALDTTTGNITFTGNTTGAEGAEVLNDINTDGTVNITGDTNTVSVNTITGSNTGVINKTGANTLALNDNNSGFLGNFTQTAGKTEVLKEFFGGDSTVESSSVDMKDGSSVVESATVTLGNKGIINIVEDANVKINGTVEANTAKNDAAINNDGNIEVNGTLIADVIQDSTDASITVNNGAKFGTQNDGSAIAAGSLTIKQGAVIDGIVEITEAVKLDFDGVKVDLSRLKPCYKAMNFQVFLSARRGLFLS